MEANFVEHAHDKQGFERITVLTRLETRLVQMQKAYRPTTNLHGLSFANETSKISDPLCFVGEGGKGVNLLASICNG